MAKFWGQNCCQSAVASFICSAFLPPFVLWCTSDICLKPEEFKLICDKYQVKDAGNDSEYVRYLDFCADVDPEDAIRPLVCETISSYQLHIFIWPCI